MSDQQPWKLEAHFSSHYATLPPTKPGTQRSVVQLEQYCQTWALAVDIGIYIWYKHLELEASSTDDFLNHKILWDMPKSTVYKKQMQTNTRRWVTGTYKV